MSGEKNGLNAEWVTNENPIVEVRKNMAVNKTAGDVEYEISSVCRREMEIFLYMYIFEILLKCV